MGGDGGAKVLERVGGWVVVGGAGDPNSVHAAGYQNKATAALLSSFSMHRF